MNVSRLSALIAAGLLALPAQAELINSDWQNAGDNQVITDTDTGLEWLSLNATAGMSYNTVISGLDSHFVGWRLPTELEATQLFDNVFPDAPLGPDGGSYVFSQPAQVSAWLTAFRDGGSIGYGLLDDGSTLSIFGAARTATKGYVYKDHADYAHSFSRSNYGTLLVRDVSAPASLGLLGLLTLAGMRRRTK